MPGDQYFGQGYFAGGNAAVAVQVSVSQTSTARIATRPSVQQTVAAGIELDKSQSIQTNAYIAVTPAVLQTSKARIATKPTVLRNASARIVAKPTLLRNANARIVAKPTVLRNAKARIINPGATKIVTSVAKISNTFFLTINQTAIARTAIAPTRSQTAKAFIKAGVSYQQTATAAVRSVSAAAYTVSSVARIANVGMGNRNIVVNGFFDVIPAITALQTAQAKWLNGTAAGSAVNQYHWYGGISGGAKAQFDNTNLFYGQNSMHIQIPGPSSVAEIKNDSTFYYGTAQNPMKPLTKYNISGWIMASNVAGSAATGGQVALLVANAAGLSTSGATPVSGILANQGWTYFSQNYTSPADAASAHIELRVYGHNGAATLSGDWWFAQVRIYEIGQNVPATARIAAPRTVTQTVAARVAINPTAVTVTAAAWIAQNPTVQQTSKARIVAKPSKLQTAIARIAKVFTKTQTSKARAASLLTRAQNTLARVGNTIPRTQPAIAQVIQSAVVKLQTVAARVANKPTKTQSSIARAVMIGVKRVNTITNPSFETGTAGWSPYKGTQVSFPTVVQDSTHSVFGSSAMMITTPGVNTGGNNYGAQTTCTGLQPGKQYTFSGWVYSDVAMAGLNLLGNGNVNVNFSFVSGWARFSVTYTASGTSATNYFRDSNINHTYWVDGVMNEPGAAPGSYFDGSSPGAAWTGTPHGSTSTLTGVVQPATAHITAAVSYAQTVMAQITRVRTLSQPATAHITAVVTRDVPTVAAIKGTATYLVGASATIQRSDIYYVGGGHAYVGTAVGVTVQAGDIIIASCSWNTTGGNAGVSDTRGNGYTLRANQATPSNFTRLMVWTAIANASGPVTVNVSGGFADMGLSVDVFRGGRTTPTITQGGQTGMRNPDLITLTTYPHGATFTYYANESTPITTPTANNNTLIQYDSVHADARFQNSNVPGGTLSFGYNTATQYNNQNSMGIAMGFAPFAASATIQGTARIATNPISNVNSKTRIVQPFTRQQTTIARMSRTFQIFQTAIAKVIRFILKTQPATARIRKISTKTQTARGSLVASNFYYVTVKARIFYGYMDGLKPPDWTDAQPGGDSDFNPIGGGDSDWTPAEPHTDKDYR